MIINSGIWCALPFRWNHAPPIIVPCFDNDLSCPDARVTSDAASLISPGEERKMIGRRENEEEENREEDLNHRVDNRYERGG